MSGISFNLLSTQSRIYTFWIIIYTLSILLVLWTWNFQYIYIYIYIYMYIYMCVCVCFGYNVNSRTKYNHVNCVIVDEIKHALLSGGCFFPTQQHVIQQTIGCYTCTTCMGMHFRRLESFRSSLNILSPVKRRYIACEDMGTKSNHWNGDLHFLYKIKLIVMISRNEQLISNIACFVCIYINSVCDFAKQHWKRPYAIPTHFALDCLYSNYTVYTGVHVTI